MSKPTLFAGLSISVILVAVAAVALSLLADGDSTVADVAIEGVPADELAADGFIVESAPLDASPEVSGDEIVAAMNAVDPSLKTLDVVLVTFRSREGEFTTPRLAWAISLDPATVKPPPVFGPPGVDSLTSEESRVVKYAVEFYDANTGEFIIGSSVSGVSD